MRIAILGAECTGKTQLAQELVTQLQGDFTAAQWEPEYLREWCDAHGRTPLVHQQPAIAREHMARILRHPPDTLLLCDTTPLMTAVCSDVILGDTTLYQWALEQHQAFELTLLTGMDLPWVADGIQRDGPEMRSRVDQRLREVLIQNRISFSMVYGCGPDRAQQARIAILSACGNAPDTPPGNWKWTCEKCSDADCEHRIFSGLIDGK